MHPKVRTPDWTYVMTHNSSTLAQMYPQSECYVICMGDLPPANSVDAPSIEIKLRTYTKPLLRRYIRARTEWYWIVS